MTSYAPPRAPGVSAESQQPEPAAPIPRWRRVIALVGWGIPIAVLITLNLWGILQLAQGPRTSAPVTTDTGTTAVDSPPPQAFPEVPTVVTSPPPTSPPPEAFPEVPTVITSPPPGQPTEMALSPDQ
jgi:hypothetical protein